VKEPNMPVRLNKFISNSGVCSRREADEYIQNGEITVNGEVVTTLGTKVLPSDEIRWNGDKLSGEKKVYIVLNKPKGYVTTVEDPHADKTVMDLIAGACSERVYPVGRLDKNTTGVLLFTNDGELTKTLTHPSYNKRKVYQVTLDKTLKKPDMEQLVAGVELEDGAAVADEVGYTNMEDKTEVGLEIHSGRNRVVRRMFETLGYEVKKLDRVYFAGLTKKSLERGKWRFLSPKEVSILKMGAYE
jgi:23S rRNA pseudouridine2605 synthase